VFSSSGGKRDQWESRLPAEGSVDSGFRSTHTHTLKDRFTIENTHAMWLSHLSTPAVET
jgi:hypothetical protein